VNERRKPRRALGKGLGALIPGAEGARRGPLQREYFLCPIDRIRPSSLQPRRSFDKKGLEDLAASIREQGVIEAPVVRRVEDGYEIIAGERRWRAAMLAGLKEIPVVIKDASAADAFEMALVENIQREDLNPLEEARAFQHLIDERGYTQTRVAMRVGRDRSTVTNSLRLLKLPGEVQEMVLSGDLSEGHARAILQAGSASRMISLARRAASGGLSVRETERIARDAGRGRSPGSSKGPSLSANVRDLVERLQRALGARVRIADRKGKGKLEITYTSYEELDRVIERILGRRR